jgi:dihydroorotate dehydrogenase electron transfer subunit
VFDVEAPLVDRRQVSRDMYVLRFLGPDIARGARPGQFVNLLLRPGPLLRRPFSVYQTGVEGTFEVLVRAVGVGTAQLLELEPGESVSALGPLGRGFTLDPAWGSVVLISGGLGVGPMPLTARWAAELGLAVTWVHGACSREDLCRESSGELLVATDDGSAGFHGTAVDAVPDGPGAVIGCGPNPMLAAIAARWPDAQVAVETYMACGTGVCLGCAVPLRSGGYNRACSEGPVYRASEVDWPSLPGRLHYADDFAGAPRGGWKATA